MIKIQIEIPDEKEELIKKALNYPEQIWSEEGDIDNPQSVEEYTTDWVLEKINVEINRQERTEAINNMSLTKLKNERKQK